MDKEYENVIKPEYFYNIDSDLFTDMYNVYEAVHNYLLRTDPEYQTAYQENNMLLERLMQSFKKAKAADRVRDLLLACRDYSAVLSSYFVVQGRFMALSHYLADTVHTSEGQDHLMKGFLEFCQTDFVQCEKLRAQEYFYQACAETTDMQQRKLLISYYDRQNDMEKYCYNVYFLTGYEMERTWQSGLSYEKNAEITEWMRGQFARFEWREDKQVDSEKGYI